MAIPVECAGCGNTLRVKDELSGKRVQCPSCGHVLSVARSRPADAPAEGEADLARWAGTNAGRRGAKNKQKTRRSSKARWVIGLSVGGAIAVLAIVLVFVFGNSENEQQLAKEKGGSSPQSQRATDSPARTTATEAEHSAARAPKEAIENLPKKEGKLRTYPSFPDALTEPPAWIGSDAPFDVAKFLEAPLPDQNAAPLYLDALLEFSSDVTTCFHEVGQRPDGEILRRAEAAKARSKEYSRLEEAMSKAPASVDNAAVDVWLKGYETGFEKLAAAQQRPACVFETGIGAAALLLHIQGARQAARVVKWRTRRDLARGNFERPIQGVETVLRLSRDLRPRADVVCQLVSVVAIDNICCEEIVPAILTTKGITAQHCDRLLAALVRHEAEARDPFLEVTRLAYVMDRSVLHDLQRRTGMFDPQYMKDELRVRGPVDSPFACLSVLRDFCSYSNRLAREKYGEAIPRTPQEALKHPLARGWSVDGKLFTANQYAREVDAVNRVYKSLLDLADRTNLERDRECATGTMADPLRDTTVAIYLEPRPPHELQAFLRAEAILRGTKCLVALRRWQFEQPQPPADPAVLVRAVGMTAVPTDPYTDQPLRMSTFENQPVIYSVGPDGKDDQARPAEIDRRTSMYRGDFVFRLQPPQ